MDEKLQSILDSVRITAAVVGDAVTDAAYDIGAGTAGLLSAGKMSVRLAGVEASVLTELRRVGEMVYATHTGTPTDTRTLLAKLREIDELKAEASLLRQEIARARGVPVCSSCGRIGEKGDRWCRDCGRAL